MKIANRSILVLEDEPIIAFALEDMLAAQGAVPIGAGSLDDADRALAGGQVQAAILDVNVHQDNSYGFARALAEQAVPFIFATGYGEALHPPEFANVPTITKPYTWSDIERAFASLSID